MSNLIIIGGAIHWSCHGPLPTFPFGGETVANRQVTSVITYLQRQRDLLYTVANPWSACAIKYLGTCVVCWIYQYLMCYILSNATINVLQ